MVQRVPPPTTRTQHPKNNSEGGNVVLVKDEKLHLSQWVLGIVTELYPGADGNVRVVSIKNKLELLKCHISKLAPLSQQDELQSTCQLRNRQTKYLHH